MQLFCFRPTELSHRIELQMQREFDKNTAYQQYHLKIQDFKILERRKRSFNGQATLKYDGQSYRIPVQIYKRCRVIHSRKLRKVLLHSLMRQKWPNIRRN